MILRQLHLLYFFLFCVIAISIPVNGINLHDELNITQDQKIAIDKLRNFVLPYITESYMKHDLYLLRWLRATQFNVNETKRRIIEDIRWRKDRQITKLMGEDFTDIFEDYPYIYTADRQGQPTFIAYAGEWDIRNSILTGQSPRIFRYMTQILESLTHKIRELQLEGKNVTRANLIVDLGGFSVAQHACPSCLVRILEFIFIYDGHYTGIADNVFLINAPPTVAATLELIKNAANPETRKAIKVFGRDRNVWQKAIYSIISPDKLPVEFGGTKPRSDFYPELYRIS